MMGPEVLVYVGGAVVHVESAVAEERHVVRRGLSSWPAGMVSVICVGPP